MFHLDKSEAIIKEAVVQRKLALKELRTRVKDFIDYACKVDSGCVKIRRMGSHIAPWIEKLFGEEEKDELFCLFDKVKRGYSGDLSNERIFKWLRRWPSEEKILEAFEEFRIAAKSF